MNLPQLQNFDLKGKTVLVRADLDAPLKCQMSNVKCQIWSVADETRLENCLETIKYLLERNCRVVLLGHLGRPLRQAQGKLTGEVKTKFSLQPVAEKLEKMVRKKIRVIGEIGEIGGIREKEERGDERGKIVMLENLRFWPGEEKNDKKFAKRLAGFGDFYVNECFSGLHRKHASLVGIPKLLPHAAGFYLLKEVKILSRVLKNPKRPVVVVIGGAKEEKLRLIPKFLKIADFILIGGWLLKRIPKARQMADSKKIFACLTKDGKDITVESAKRLGEIIKKGGTVVWSGPMGVYEDERDIKGTEIVAEAIANSKAFKIAGGGDTEAAIDILGLKEKFDWISSGGGAMLEFLAYGSLPGITALYE